MLLKLKKTIIFSENDNHEAKIFSPDRHAVLIEQRLIASAKKCIVKGFFIEISTGAVIHKYFDFVFDEHGVKGKLLNGTECTAAMKEYATLNESLADANLLLTKHQMEIQAITSDSTSSKIIREQVWVHTKVLEEKLATITNKKSSAYKTTNRDISTLRDKSASLSMMMRMNDGGLVVASENFESQRRIVLSIQEKINAIAIPQGIYENLDTFEEVVNYFDKYGNPTKLGIEWLLRKNIGGVKLSEHLVA